MDRFRFHVFYQHPGPLTGFANYSFPGNAFVPGAIGDTLTSFAGELFEASDQTSLPAFLNAGASGSYGTVVEPRNYLEKFPDRMGLLLPGPRVQPRRGLLPERAQPDQA